MFIHNLFLNCQIVLKFCTEHMSALCKISKWFDNWHGCYGEQSFCNIVDLIQVPNLQMVSSDLTKWLGTSGIVPVIAIREHPILFCWLFDEVKWVKSFTVDNL